VNRVDPTGMDGYYFSGEDAQRVFRYLQSQLTTSGTGVTIKQLSIFAGETGGGVHITDDMFLGFMGNIIRIWEVVVPTVTSKPRMPYLPFLTPA